MATQNGESCEHITIFFMNLMRMHFLADPTAAEVKLIKSQCSEICGTSNIEVIGNAAERRNQLLCSQLEMLFCVHL